MAQINITESQSRELYTKSFGLNNSSILVSSMEDLRLLEHLDHETRYVVKADTLVSGRMKRGMIRVGIDLEKVKRFITDNIGSMADSFIVQPFIKHDQECYLSFETMPEYDLIRFSRQGGIEIEDNWDKIEQYQIGLDDQELDALKGHQYYQEIKDYYCFFVDSGMAFLEINPLAVTDRGLVPLDFKARLDSEAGDNYLYENHNATSPIEQAISQLDHLSGASLKYTTLNPDGRVWPMIAGGGASIVYFDLISDKFRIDQIGFYGEYSGNPSIEETYQYAKLAIKAMLDSKAKSKILLIAGGNANFTDVARTFTGIIQALEDLKSEMIKQGITVIVRRGGPNDQIGLRKIKDFLDDAGISNHVYGLEVEIPDTFEEYLNE